MVQCERTVIPYTSIPKLQATTYPKGVTMEVKLLIAQPKEPQREIVLTELPALIGRSFNAKVRPDDRWVSREHCEIDELGGGLVIRDLQSKHGTFVNGLRIDKTVLLPGDDVTIGETHLLVCEPNGKTSAEESELDDSCEAQPGSQQPTPACRSAPTGPFRQHRRLGVIRTFGRMLEWCRARVISRRRTPRRARRSGQSKAIGTSRRARSAVGDVGK